MMKNWIITAIMGIGSVAAYGQWASVDTWTFDGNDAVPLSENGIRLGNYYDTNNMVVAQVPDDGLFIFSAVDVAKSSNKEDLSATVDLNSNKVRLAWSYDSFSFVTNASKHWFRLWDDVGEKWVGLSIEEDSNGKIWAFASDSQGMSEKTGRLARETHPEDFDMPRTIYLELDYRSNKILVYADAWQWTNDGIDHVFEIDYDFRQIGYENVAQIMTRHANWAEGVQIVQDRVAVEVEAQPEGVYIDQFATHESKFVAETNTFAHLDMVDGDWVLVQAALNNAAWDESVIQIEGTGAPATVMYQDISGSGPRTAAWYAPISKDGEVTVTVRAGEGQESRASVAAYVIRSASGDVDILSMASTASVSKEESSMVYTNIYTYPMEAEGIYVEAISAYATDWSVDNASYAADVFNSTDNRMVGAGQFSNVSGMTNIWTTAMETNQQAVVSGFVFVSGLLPEERYAAWMGGYDVGEMTDFLDDPDGDGLNNLSEYAFGGRPDDASDRGHYPMQSMVSDEGVNYLEYVHYERSDAQNRGLSYDLFVGSNLLHGDWTQDGIEYLGTGAGPAGFNTVTNRIDTAVSAAGFLDLRVTFEP